MLSTTWPCWAARSFWSSVDQLAHPPQLVVHARQLLLEGLVEAAHLVLEGLVEPRDLLGDGLAAQVELALGGAAVVGELLARHLQHGVDRGPHGGLAIGGRGGGQGRGGRIDRGPHGRVAARTSLRLLGAPGDEPDHAGGDDEPEGDDQPESDDDDDHVANDKEAV